MRTLLIGILCLLTIPLGAKPFVEGAILAQLGNQMFQVAAAYSLALDHDAEPIFPMLQLPSVKNGKLNRENVFHRVNTRKKSRRSRFRYSEKHFHYSPIPYQPDMTISGFFQSDKYFKHHKEEILALYAPHQGILDYLQAKYPEVVGQPNTVAVHVRTYLPDFPNGSAILPFLGWEYFEDIIKTFPEDYRFVVCSDRIDLCKKHLSHIDRDLIFAEGNHHYQDLYLMSLCAHNIISNSSFSWWAAYLNRNPEKIVVAPPIWFGFDANFHDTKDLIPDEWVSLR